ncbi:MAG: cytochrome b/b6 domain-containing protein [Leucobacter sp.]
MATYSSEIRQGLPRVSGGEPWPAGGALASGAAVQAAAPVEPVVVVDQVQEAAPTSADAVAPVEEAPVEINVPVASATPTAPAPAAGSSVSLRRGLPRVPGGDAWPAVGTAAVPAAVGAAATQASEPAAKPVVAARHAAETPAVETTAETAASATLAASAATVPAAEFVASETPLRRGLPRTQGGEAWPAEGFAPAMASAPAPVVGAAAPAAPVAPSETVPVAASSVAPAQTASAPVEEASPEAQPSTSSQASTPSQPVPAATREPAQAATEPAVKAAKPKRDPIMIGAKTLSQWVKLAILGIVGAVVAAGIIVLAARGVTTLPGVPEWLVRYPGEYALPETAEPGFPWWARWSHALNIFLIVLIIRSGLLVRHQQKPPAFFTPKRGGKKISINLWLHTSLDVVWLVNGVVFVVLLFVSGHWMRIVPTSWEVFPNAMSAMLQYLTLDWPTEHGWVNYNSLQQLMYFIIVFIAAPLAAITGVRMSEWWPKNAEKLNKFYPAPLARAVHFPTMLFFVLFILVHVFLVFTTGALRNLNHMFAGTDFVNWFGFWMFALTIFLTALGWVAARPLVLAPIASLFGKVSNR